MINLECLKCKCNTCKDDYCKLESCGEECRENKVNPHSGDCQGYCAAETVDQSANVNPVPFRKILVVNGQFNSGGKSLVSYFSAKRSEAVVIKTQSELDILLDGLVYQNRHRMIDLKRFEIINAKEVEG